jgi:hypothetical protein
MATSLILLGIYLNVLLRKLCDTNIECSVKSRFVGALAYVHDHLLAPTAGAMHKLQGHETDEFCIAWQIGACRVFSLKAKPSVINGILLSRSWYQFIDPERRKG